MDPYVPTKLEWIELRLNAECKRSDYDNTINTSFVATNDKSGISVVITFPNRAPAIVVVQMEKFAKECVERIKDRTGSNWLKYGFIKEGY